jgi:hypothetical protein
MGALQSVLLFVGFVFVYCFADISLPEDFAVYYIPAIIDLGRASLQCLSLLED